MSSKANTSNRGKRVIRRMVIAIVAALLVLLLSAALFLLLRSPGKTAPLADAQGNPISGSVAEIVRTDIGGVEQGMILRGESVQSPVLLFLHGGPGSPMYAMIQRTPALQKGLESMFTVCYWEQRGAGMSYSRNIPAESMTVDQLVEDTAEVARYLIDRFGQEKVYVLGASWGTFLGAHAAAKYPELFHAFIGVGQITDTFKSEQLAYDYMMQQATQSGDEALLERLSKYTLVDAQSLSQEYLALRNEGLNKYGAGLKREMGSPLAEQILPVMMCREYTPSQKMNFQRGALFSIEHLWDSVMQENLFETVPRIDVPVYIIQGVYDYICSYALAESYLEALEAPRKAFIPFEQSAHMPFLEEPEHFLQVLSQQVLAQK